MKILLIIAIMICTATIIYGGWIYEEPIPERIEVPVYVEVEKIVYVDKVEYIESPMEFGRFESNEELSQWLSDTIPEIDSSLSQTDFALMVQLEAAEDGYLVSVEFCLNKIFNSTIIDKVIVDFDATQWR